MFSLPVRQAKGDGEVKISTCKRVLRTLRLSHFLLIWAFGWDIWQFNLLQGLFCCLLLRLFFTFPPPDSFDLPSDGHRGLESFIMVRPGLVHHTILRRDHLHPMS